MKTGALDLPPDAFPRSERVLRRRLRNAFRNMGYPVPRDLAEWETARMRAVWVKLIKGRAQRREEDPADGYADG